MATTRDRVWATVWKYLVERDRTRLGGGRLKIDFIIARSDELEESERRTVRRTLNSMAELGVLDHEPGSPYWREPEDFEETIQETAEEIEKRERNLQILSDRVG